MSDVSEVSPAGAAPVWLQRKERGSMWLMRLMSWLSLTLGRRLTRVIVHAIALYFLLAVPASRRASRAYLARCLGRRPSWLDLYRHMLTFATTVHDRLYLLNDRFDLFDVRFEGEVPGQGAEEGAFLFGAHLGSFEVLRTLARKQATGRVCVAMYPDNARQINAILAAINPSAVADIIALGEIDSIFQIHERIEHGDMVGILADRAIRDERQVAMPFLGAPADFPQGPFRLAVAMRHPVYFMSGLYLGHGRYELRFERLTDGGAATRDRQACVEDLMQKYVDALERHCRRAPYNWFNFYDFWQTRSKASA
ncbi:LpxL/LpxP family acyltransferase [Aquabacterium parvum]|uniref:LpxL/LpxP family acyltransferase n=1 Tax=Aquabacterium parvum TaxID=70584 RepID=UPI000719018B|nr:acyl-CoA synthetase [Aquabacterium parvum]